MTASRLVRLGHLVVDTPLLVLAVVLTLASIVQTSIGFGSMVVAVTLGALVMDIPTLIALVVPASLVQTLVVVLRHRSEVSWDLLGRRVLPLMGLGMMVSLGFGGGVDTGLLKLAFGAMVLVMALRELVRSEPGPPPSPWVARAALVGAGVVHGLFATGGPLLVWALGRQPIEKSVFRTSLTALWLVLNVVLVSAFVVRGDVTLATASISALLVVPVFFGILIGERLHDRVDEARFRHIVWIGLGVAAVALILPSGS